MIIITTITIIIIIIIYIFLNIIMNTIIIIIIIIVIIMTNKSIFIFSPFPQFYRSAARLTTMQYYGVFNLFLQSVIV